MAGSYRLARVLADERSVLVRHGKPIAPLVPLDASPRRQLGWLQGSLDEAFFVPRPSQLAERQPALADLATFWKGC